MKTTTKKILANIAKQEQSLIEKRDKAEDFKLKDMYRDAIDKLNEAYDLIIDSQLYEIEQMKIECKKLINS